MEYIGNPYEINKELAKWEDRVIYNVKFKEDTKANLKRLDTIFNNSLKNFTTIAANSEALVYKIGRYFISRGLKNDQVAFIDGQIVKSYVGDDSAEWKKKERIDVFSEIFIKPNKCKWIIIPNMSFPISVGLAVYFITKFKVYDIAGLIFYGEGPDNLIETLVCHTDIGNFYQFPKADYYARKKRILPEDEW